MSIDEAWKRVEGALPEGWRLDGLHSVAVGPEYSEWQWKAKVASGGYFRSTVRPTPAAALNALADELASRTVVNSAPKVQP